MKKIVLLFGLFFTFFLCVKCTSDSETLTDAIDTEQATVAITEIYDGETNERIPDTTIDETESCGGILIETFTLQPTDANGCCKMVLNITSKNQASYRVYVNGVFYGGGNSHGTSFLIPICNDPKFVQVYSDGVLCYSKVLTCKERCCDEVKYTIESRWIDGCCIFTFTVLKSEIGCNNFQYGLTKLGNPPTQFQLIDGNPTFTATLCDGDDQVRFFIVDNTTGQICQATNWYNNNSCVP